MDRVLKVHVVSPVTTVFHGEATSVVASAWDGKVGILVGHAPFITLLGGGELELKLPGGAVERFFLNRGVLKVEHDHVTILAEYAARERPADFDPTSAWIDPAEMEVLADPGNPLV